MTEREQINDQRALVLAASIPEAIERERARARVEFADRLLAVVNEWKADPLNERMPPFVFSNLILIATETDRKALGLPVLGGLVPP